MLQAWQSGPHCLPCRSHKESANNAQSKVVYNDFLFVASDGGAKTSMSKWIIDLGAMQHMTPHRQAFDTHESIPCRKLFIGDNGMVEAIGKGGRASLLRRVV